MTKLAQDIEFCSEGFASFSSWNPHLFFCMYGKYFPHDLVPSPNFLCMEKWAFANSSQINFQSNHPSFSLLAFLSFYMVYLFWLISKQRSIFTISRNSIWAPASINFSTIAKCPSKHALWRAVRLYCQNRDWKREKTAMHIKMCINSFRGMKLVTVMTQVTEKQVLPYELGVSTLTTVTELKQISCN